MFGCRSCSTAFARALVAVAADEQLVLQHGTRNYATWTLLRKTAGPSVRARFASTTVKERTRAESGLPLDVQTYQEAGTDALKGNAAIRSFQGLDTGKSKKIEEHYSIVDGTTPIDRAQLRKRAVKELEYVREPFRLAERTLSLVNNGEIDQAVYLVRQAGLLITDTIVSWNYIFDVLTKSGLLEPAYKLYHDMKKRGQQPNSRTYTILLKGYKLKQSSVDKDLDRARSIYDSLYAAESPVRPNTIHGNIMIEVYARAGRLDQVFEIAAKLSDRGANAPDEITYTTIFNAISNAPTRSPAQPSQNRDRMVTQAKKIWLDIIEQWKSGSLPMGEEMICAMGRVLLTSTNSSDHYEIFALLEEAMQVPNQLAHKMSLQVDGSNAQGDLVTSQADNTKIDKPSTLQKNPETKSSGRSVSWSADTVGLIYKKPGNKVLSLVLATCLKLRENKAACKYWDLLADQFTPDTLNFVKFMYHLKQTGDSATAAVTLKRVYKLSRDRNSTVQLHPALWEHGMAACIRSSDVKNALRDATRILVMLQMSAAEPYLEVIEKFAHVLSRSRDSWPIEDVMRAEEALMIAFGNIKSLYAFGRTDTNGPSPPSGSLDKLITDIDSNWRPTARTSFRISMSRETLAMQARSRISPTQRTGIRSVGRLIERTLAQIIRTYEPTMTQDQVKRIRADLYRVRAWVFADKENDSVTTNDTPQDNTGGVSAPVLPARSSAVQRSLRQGKTSVEDKARGQAVPSATISNTTASIPEVTEKGQDAGITRFPAFA